MSQRRYCARMYRKNTWKSSARFRTRVIKSRLPVRGFSTPKRVRRALLPVIATRACSPRFVHAARSGGNSRSRLSSSKRTVRLGSARIFSISASFFPSRSESLRANTWRGRFPTISQSAQAAAQGGLAQAHAFVALQVPLLLGILLQDLGQPHSLRLGEAGPTARLRPVHQIGGVAALEVASSPLVEALPPPASVRETSVALLPSSQSSRARMRSHARFSRVIRCTATPVCNGCAVIPPIYPCVYHYMRLSTWLPCVADPRPRAEAIDEKPPPTAHPILPTGIPSRCCPSVRGCRSSAHTPRR